MNQTEYIVWFFETKFFLGDKSPIRCIYENWICGEEKQNWTPIIIEPLKSFEAKQSQKGEKFKFAPKHKLSQSWKTQLDNLIRSK